MVCAGDAGESPTMFGLIVVHSRQYVHNGPGSLSLAGSSPLQFSVTMCQMLTHPSKGTA